MRLTKLQALVLAAVLALGVWNAWEGEWLWAGLDFTVFLGGAVAYGYLNRATGGSVKLATDLAEQPDLVPARLSESSGWRAHMDECAPCRDFWKKDRL